MHDRRDYNRLFDSRGQSYNCCEMTNYEITFHENALPEDLQVISDGLESHTRTLFSDKDRTEIAFFLRDETGRIVGGVNGNYGTFGWLYVNALWVDESLRGRGFGQELMLRIETEAARNGAKNAFLNTMSFQAPEFYRKLGYEVFGILEDFPGEHSRIFLRKRLV
jgi:ribosomal protein S18 acetylase RimI-like enzyme